MLPDTCQKGREAPLPRGRLLSVDVGTEGEPWPPGRIVVSLKVHSPLIPSPLLCSANTLGLFPAQDLGLGYCFCLGHSSLKQSCTFSFTWVELKCHLLREAFLDQSS